MNFAIARTTRGSLLATAATFALTSGTAFAVDTFWDGDSGSDWSTAGSWNTGNVPTNIDKAFINDISLSTPEVTANTTASELLVGFTSTTGAVNISAGTLTVEGWTVIGNGGTGDGTVNITGSGSLVTNTAFGNFQIAEVAGSTGEVNVNTTGGITSGEMIVGNGGNGTLNIDAGSVTTTDLRVATNATGAQGSIDLNGGTMTVNGFGRWGASTNSVANIDIAAGTTMTINNTGNVAEALRIGEGAGSSTTVNVNGALDITNRNVRIGSNSNSSTATNIVNVNAGGSMSVENDFLLGFSGGAGSSSTLNLDGGTVNVGSTTERWMMIGQWDAQDTTTDIKNGGTLNLNAGSDIKMGVQSGGNLSGTHTINVNGAGSLLNGTGSGGTATTLEMGRYSANGNFVLNLENGGQANLQAIYTNTNNASAIVNFDGGILQALGDDANFIRLNGVGTREVNVLAGGATIDSNGFNVTIGNAMTGVGTLTKDGAGALTLENAGNSVGAASVSAGTLFITGQLGTTGGTTVSSTATIGGNGTLLGNLTLETGATIDISLGALNIDSGATVLFNGLALTDIAGIDLGTASNGTYNVLAGSFTIDGASVISNLGEGNAADLGGGRSAYFEAGSLNLVVVPEPGVALLGGLGLLTLLRRRRS